jgi:hypothetical protein
MLTIDPDKVCAIIIKARVFDADLDTAGDDPGSDLAHGEVEDVEVHDETTDEAEADNTEDELAEMISDLNEDEQIELVALAWLGRGSYAVEEWEDAKGEAANAHNDRTAQYLMGMPLLADYLEEGLAAFGQSCG